MVFIRELDGMKITDCAQRGITKRFADRSCHTVAKFGVLWLFERTNGSVENKHRSVVASLVPRSSARQNVL